MLLKIQTFEETFNTLDKDGNIISKITKVKGFTIGVKRYLIPFDTIQAALSGEEPIIIDELLSKIKSVSKESIEELTNTLYETYNNISFFDNVVSRRTKIDGHYFDVLQPQRKAKSINGEPIKSYIERILKSKISFAECLPIAESGVKKWLTALKRLMPVLKVTENNHKHAANVMQHFVSNIRHYAGDDTYKAYHNEHVPFLYSDATGGTGKTLFIDTFSDYISTTCGEEAITTLNDDFATSEYASAILATKTEATHFRANDLINNVFDNTTFVTNEKYKARVTLKSKVSAILASNTLPPDSNTRRYGIIDYDSTAPFSEWTDEQQTLYGYNEDMQQYIVDLFKYCPKDPLYTLSKKNRESERDSRIERVIIDNIHILEEYVRNRKQVTATILMKDLTSEGVDGNIIIKNYDISHYEAFINNRIINKEMSRLKKAGYTHSIARFTKEYLAKLSILSTTCENDTDEICNVASSVDASIAEWNKLIDDVETDPTDNKPTKIIEEYTTTDVIPNAIECADKYDTQMQTISNDNEKEFMMLAVNKEGHTGRKQDDVIPSGFSFESDNLTMEQQQELFNETINNPLINDACYSGNKSIHYHVLMKEPTPMTSDEYRYCWNHLANKIFKNNYDNLDKSMSNMNRLTRKPNAIRKDNGNVQSLLYVSDNKMYFDPTRIIRDYRNFIELQQYVKPNIEQTTINDSVAYLKNSYNKNHKETIKLALDALEQKQIPSGSNLIGTLNALKSMNIDKAIIYQVAMEFNKQHPSNIPLSTVEKYK